MFFCETCRKDREWPESMFKSVGPCEVCGKKSECNEVKSSLLPVRSQSTKGGFPPADAPGNFRMN